MEPAAFSRQIAAHDALLCFSERIFSHLIDAFKLEDAANGPRFPGALEGKVGEGIAIYQGGFGGPAAGALMEALEGGVWTTGALLRETADKVRALAEQGVLAVEMEGVALNSVVQYRGIDFVAAVVITDELFRGAWVQGFRTEEVERSQELLCRALAEGFRRNGRFVAE